MDYGPRTYYTYTMISNQARHSQKVGSKLKEKHGTSFFSNINPKKKLSEERVETMLGEFFNRLKNKKTGPMIAEKYGVTIATVYYHARRRDASEFVS